MKIFFENKNNYFFHNKNKLYFLSAYYFLDNISPIGFVQTVTCSNQSRSGTMAFLGTQTPLYCTSSPNFHCCTCRINAS